jgi:hypothetical protein
MQIIMNVGVERKRPPIPPECPPPLARLIRECWRHNAALRPGFGDIARRLRAMRSASGSQRVFSVPAAGGGAAHTAPPGGRQQAAKAHSVFITPAPASARPAVSRRLEMT